MTGGKTRMNTENTEFESKLAALKPRIDREIEAGIFPEDAEQRPEKVAKWRFSAELSKRSLPLKTVVTVGIFAFLLGGVAMFVLLNSFCEIRSHNDEEYYARQKIREPPQIDFDKIETIGSTVELTKLLASSEKKPAPEIPPEPRPSTAISLQRELMREF